MLSLRRRCLLSPPAAAARCRCPPHAVAAPASLPLRGAAACCRCFAGLSRRGCCPCATPFYAPRCHARSVDCSRSKVYPPAHSMPSAVDFKIYMWAGGQQAQQPSCSPRSSTGRPAAFPLASPSALCRVAARARVGAAAGSDCERSALAQHARRGAHRAERAPCRLLHPCRYEIPTQLSYENRQFAGWEHHDQIYVAWKMVRGGAVGCARVQCLATTKVCARPRGASLPGLTACTSASPTCMLSQSLRFVGGGWQKEGGGGHPVLVPAGMARCPPVSRHTPSRRSRSMALPFCAAVPAAVPDQPGANRGPLCRQPLLHPGLCVRLLWWVLAHLGGQPSWSQAGQRHEGSARPGQPGRQSAHVPTMHARGFAGAVRRVQGGTEAVGWIRGLPAGQLRTNAEPASLQYTCGISSSRLLFLPP